MRTLLALALALVLLVALCSATLRLSQSGVGCTPWPTCYAQASAEAPRDAEIPAWQHTLRLTHRISATVAGLAFVFIVAFGFGGWSRSQRVAGASLWALAAALAFVGRITPSQLPAVVLANLLGGHLLLAALAWLLTPALQSVDTLPSAIARELSWPLWAFVLLVLVSGGLVSARTAVAACADGCGLDLASWPDALAAWQPWRGNAAWADGIGTPMRQALLQLHVVLGALAMSVLCWAAWRVRRCTGAATVAALTALAAVSVALLGIGPLQQALGLGAATAHSVLGGFTLAGSAALWRVLAPSAGRGARPRGA
ncbi:MAG TPA: COX15/CtaA family protein [Burkholderiaceae bacterium]|nr:COX15/CtaA family protein [Burkholderiaceae bacterium]